jgi:hypothetical protein
MHRQFFSPFIAMGLSEQTYVLFSRISKKMKASRWQMIWVGRGAKDKIHAERARPGRRNDRMKKGFQSVESHRVEERCCARDGRTPAISDLSAGEVD